MTEHPPDPLAEAFELATRFHRSGADVESFLAQHEEHRELLEPLIRRQVSAELWRSFGDFELVREIGRGSMGVVYEALERRIGRRVALKLIPPHRAASPRALAMFQREATLAASLDHEGIARVLALQEEDGQLALVMELIDGIPLDAVLEDLSSDPSTLPRSSDLAELTGIEVSCGYVEVVVEWARQVAFALAHANSRGVVHRDVKPGNILITNEGRAVLTDFGLARFEGTPGVSTSGDFSGTYEYASPEQLAGASVEIDGRSDVFSLGVTLYEMLTLRRPFEAESVAALCRRVQEEDPQPPSTLNPDVRPDLEAVVLCALEKDRSRRYADAGVFAVELGRTLAGLPVIARRPSMPERCLRWMGRNRLVTSTVAVLLLSVLAVSWSAAEATASSRRYRNLWVGAALDGLTRQAAETHPPWLHQFDDLERLIARAESDILPMKAPLVAAIRDLRGGGTQVSRRSPDRGAHPASQRIEHLQGILTRTKSELRYLAADKRPPFQEETEAIAREVEELQEIVATSDRVCIADPQEAALHDRLEAQLYQIRRFEATVLADLRRRSQWARSVRSTTVESHVEAWAMARQRLAADQRFRGFELTPQEGLIPLGPDPSTKLEEFAHLRSGHRPNRRDGSLAISVDSGVVFVLLPGGDYQTALEEDVKLAPFFIAKHELSRAQWSRLAEGIEELHLRAGGIIDTRNLTQMDKPANGVSWRMCARLLRRFGLELPTEVQWEYAANFGGRPADMARYANLRDRAYARKNQHVHPSTVVPFDDGAIGLLPITAMAASPAGLHQIYGNVNEWCRDVHLGEIVKPRHGDGLRERPAWPSAPRIRCGGAYTRVKPVEIFNGGAPDLSVRETGVRPVRRVYSAEPERDR